MRTLVACLSLVIAAGSASAQTVDRKKLREAAEMPLIPADFGVGVYSVRYTLCSERPHPEDFRSLRAALEKDPGNADLLYRLGDLHEMAGEHSTAQKFYQNAAELFIKTTTDNPNDARLLAKQGLTLLAVRRAEEGEKALRRAVELAPNDAPCWLALAQFHRDRAWQEMSRGVLSAGTKPRGDELVPKWRVEGGVNDGGLKSLVEGKSCCDRAVALDPKLSLGFVLRAMITHLLAQMEGCLSRERGEKVDAVEERAPIASLDDLGRAVELSPENPFLVTAWYTLAVKRELLARGTDFSASPFMAGKLLPQAMKDTLRDRIARLEKAAARSSPREAAATNELLCSLYWFLDERGKAAERCHEAVRLNPDREPAWSALEATLSLEGRSDEVVEVCRERIKLRDCADARFHLAKALREQGKWKEAEEQCQAGLTQEPQHLDCTLGVVAAQLHMNDDSEITKKMSSLLLDIRDRAWEQGTPDQKTVFQNLAAVVEALGGEHDRAREALRTLVRFRPDYAPARQALQALGGDGKDVGGD